MLAHLLKRRHSVAYSEIVSSVSWQSRRVLTIHREAMENLKSCACGGQNPPKVMVYLEEKKTNFAEDKRHHRLPVTKILDKKDILYITSAANVVDQLVQNGNIVQLARDANLNFPFSIKSIVPAVV